MKISYMALLKNVLSTNIFGSGIWNLTSKVAMISLTVIICSISSWGQYSLTGTVKDANNQPMEFANILLYSLPDTNVVKGETTDIDGRFAFVELKEGDYFVKAMMLGFADYNSEKFTLNDENRSPKIACLITAEAQLLETVEVVAKVPLLEQRADRMVVNVAESLTAINGSLMDVLRKVPGVIVSNGKLRMAGSTNPTILINGRTTKYMDIDALMKEMPSDNIQKIEVIHQPGAEFDAAGTGPIINIILKQNKLFGTNGTVSLGVGRSSFLRYNGSFTINHRQGNLNLYGGAGYSHNAFGESLILNRDIRGDLYNQIADQPYKPHTQRANVGLDWYLSDKQTMGFSVNGLNSDNDRTWVNSTFIDYVDDVPNSKITSDNILERNWSYLTSTAYYSLKMDTLGHKLDLNADYATFDRKSLSLVQTRNEGENVLNFDDIRTNQPGTTDIYSIRLDYVKPFSKNLTLSAGGKYSVAELDNNLITESFDNEGWVLNTGLSNHFLFDEDIIAAYGKVNAKFGDWEFTGGLRFEESKSEGYSVTLDSTTNRTISRIFPSASFARPIGESLGIALAYSYRIDRPSYKDLNPYVLYLDPFTSERGNPLLRPELSHSAKFSLTYDKQPFFNLEYIRTNNSIEFVTEQDSESGVAFATNVNLDKFEKYGGSLFFPLDFVEGLSGYGGVMAYYNVYDSEYLNEQFNVEQWSVTAFIQANFKLPFEIETEVGGWYTNGGQDGIMNYEHMYGFSLGFERKFLNDKLSLNLSIDDVINRFFNANIDYAGFVADIESRWDTKVVNFRMNWRFGNQHLKKAERRRSGASDEINRAQSKN